MATVAVQPFVLKDVEFTVGTDDYAAHVSSVVLTPSQSTITWQGLTPSAAFSDAGSPTWTCTLNYAQDWSTTNSLSEYLFTHAGETVTVTFKPKSGSTTGTPVFTVDLILAAGQIGGDVNTVQTASVTLGVDGEPTLTRLP